MERQKYMKIILELLKKIRWSLLTRKFIPQPPFLPLSLCKDSWIWRQEWRYDYLRVQSHGVRVNFGFSGSATYSEILGRFLNLPGPLSSILPFFGSFLCRTNDLSIRSVNSKAPLKYKTLGKISLNTGKRKHLPVLGFSANELYHRS